MTETSEVKPLEETISDSFPCPEGDIFDLPTKEEIVNAFNEIAALPGKMVGKVQEMKAEKEKEIAALYKSLEDADTEEARAAINKQIAEKENYIKTQIEGVIQKEIDDVVETVEEFVDVLSGILSPYWDKEGLNRDWQKEARDAFEQLLQEFHLYIPVKIAELLSKLVPISFAINVLGIQIDVLKLVSSPSYQKELQDQISGINFDLQIVEKFKELQKINDKITKLVEELADPDISMEDHIKKSEELFALEEEKKTILGAIDIIYDLKDGFIDKFWQLVPEEFRQFDGEFGVVDNKAKAKIIWKWIKKEIKEWLQNWYLKAIQKLLSLFETIWNLLGLPELPIQILIDIINFDVKAFITSAIKAMKDAWKKLKESLQTDLQKIEGKIAKVKEQLADPDISMEDHIRLSTELDTLEKEYKKKQEEILSAKDAFVKLIKDTILDLQIFGFSIGKILGASIKSTTESIEEEISEMLFALEEFKINFHKKILFEWVTLVKKFFSAIGLGAIFDFLTITLCDFLKLIGMPMGINLQLPAIAGVISVVTKETVHKPHPQKDYGSDDGVAFTKVKVEDDIDKTEFSVTTGSGTIHAFVDGVEVEAGSGMSVSGNTVTFDTAPLTQLEYDAGITKDVSLIKI
jgi:hypothetical protein